MGTRCGDHGGMLNAMWNKLLDALGIWVLFDDLRALFSLGDVQASSVGGWLLWPRILSNWI